MSDHQGMPLKKALDSLARNLDSGNKGRLLQVKVARAWVDVAGDMVADHTFGVYLRGGELIVQVDSPVWATELSALSESYRTAINSDIGGELVRAVRFTVSREAAAKSIRQELARTDEEEKRAAPAERIPLSEQERRQVEESAGAIPDTELREAVIRATVAGLEWKKGRRAAKGRETASGDS